MSSTPHMKWYPDAALADTAMLSLEEAGAYRILLDHMWLNEGSLPDNDERVARLLRISKKKWLKIRAALEGFLIFEGGEIKNKRLSREFLEAKSVSKTNSANGKSGGIKSAEKRKENNKTEQASGTDSLQRNPSEHPSEIQASRAPLPLPIPIPEEEERGAETRTHEDVPLWDSAFYQKLEKIVGMATSMPTTVIEAWFHAGADETLILETCQHSMSTWLGGVAPRKLTAFDDDIARAIACRARKIDVPTTGENYGKSGYNQNKPSKFMAGIAGLFDDCGGGIRPADDMAEYYPGTFASPDDGDKAS